MFAEEDKEICNDNTVVSNIARDITIEELEGKLNQVCQYTQKQIQMKEEADEKYDIERMTVNTMEVHLASLDEDLKKAALSLQSAEKIQSEHKNLQCKVTNLERNITDLTNTQINTYELYEIDIAYADCLQRTICKQHKEMVTVKEDLSLREAIVTLEKEYQELKQKYDEEKLTWRIEKFTYKAVQEDLQKKYQNLKEKYLLSKQQNQRNHARFK